MLASAVRWDSSSSTTRTRVTGRSFSIFLYCDSESRGHAIMLANATASVTQIRQAELPGLSGSGRGDRRLVAGGSESPRQSHLDAYAAGRACYLNRNPAHSTAVGETHRSGRPAAL